jgi:hypothetical protein
MKAYYDVYCRGQRAGEEVAVLCREAGDCVEYYEMQLGLISELESSLTAESHPPPNTKKGGQLRGLRLLHAHILLLHAEVKKVANELVDASADFDARAGAFSREASIDEESVSTAHDDIDETEYIPPLDEQELEGGDEEEGELELLFREDELIGDEEFM